MPELEPVSVWLTEATAFLIELQIGAADLTNRSMYPLRILGFKRYCFDSNGIKGIFLRVYLVLVSTIITSEEFSQESVYEYQDSKNLLHDIHYK